MELKRKENYVLGDLLEIVALLRDPEGGCPWDKVQTHESIRMNFIEETYEVADAIDEQ
ncbi:MAG: nucleoside triphosphate pyrophosphohydrolase, partial [Pygmaiobacter sp.]